MPVVVLQEVRARFLAAETQKYFFVCDIRNMKTKLSWGEEEEETAVRVRPAPEL